MIIDTYKAPSQRNPDKLSIAHFHPLMIITTYLIKDMTVSKITKSSLFTLIDTGPRGSHCSSRHKSDGTGCYWLNDSSVVDPYSQEHQLYVIFTETLYNKSYKKTWQGISAEYKGTSEQYFSNTDTSEKITMKPKQFMTEDVLKMECPGCGTMINVDNLEEV